MAGETSCTRPARVVQIHPALRCNLACRHCYTHSGPSRTEALPEPLVQRLIADLPGLGYDAISLSGGEPLMWLGLGAALQAARAAGLSASLVTNLMPLTPSRLRAVAGALDLCAVSLDGIPASHDAIRARPGAFATMQSRLDALRESGIRFGFIFTLTRHNIAELAWIAQFALERGAALLQVHPLEDAGRAADDMQGDCPGELVANAAYLACLRLQAALGPVLPIQLDLAHRVLLARDPDRAFPGAADTGPDLSLADLVDTLVVEVDGTVVPIMHGLDRTHALGNLRDAPLPALAARWRAQAGPARLRARCARARDRALAGPHDLPAFDWYAALAA